MKLDSEPMCGHSTMVHKPVSKSLDSAVEIEGLKSGNETMREDKHRITSDLKSQNCEMDIDPLSTEKHKKDTIGNILGLDDFMDMDDLKNGRENENGDSVAPCTSPSSEIELSEKETDFYTDKSVMECEMPELIDCFKEIAYHVVKDICIDEGVPSLDKILVENGKQDSKHSFQPSDLDLSSDVTKEMVDSLAPISDEVKSLVEHDYDEDASQCSFKTLLPKGEGKFDANDAIAHGVSDEKVVPENLVALQKLDMENSCLVSSIFEGDEGQQQSELVHQCGSENLLHKGEENIDAKDEITHDVSDEIVAPENMVLLQKLDMENSRAVSSSFSGDEGQQLSDQDTSKEAISANSAVSYMTEESSNSIHVSKVPSDREVESGSITFDFDSPTPAINGREESPPNVDCQQSLQSLHTSGIEDGTVDSRTASSRSLYIQHGHGESSFSAVGPLSGPIAYSGPIPYSGSISLRSDSSTTSTRSFAFPILHSEWNSSPVKMAKADRRHYRKHRGWRLSLLCCRF